MTKLAVLFNYLAKLIIVVGILLLVRDVKAQQGGTVTYGYDANGRLTSVTLPTGESVTYSYDPAGNITNIKRVNGSGPQFLSFSPQSGFVDDTVTFTGANFGTVTSVSFNGTNAVVFSGNMTQITAKVPQSATTGQITVTLSNGTFTTTTFTVLNLQVNPSQISILPGETQQFSAIVPTELNNNNVTWSVNGVAGGNSSVGTISSTGLYIAPSITSNQTFTVRATSVARPSLFAQATVKVTPDLYQIRTSIAVQYKPELLVGQQLARISVLKGQISNNTQIFSAYSSPISVTTSPSITNISQTNLAKGSSNNITITGSNLSGTTNLVFLNDSTGVIDNSITISNLAVAGDGNSLTATITVAANSPTGDRVVVVSGATAGYSTTSNITNNIISIIP